MPRRRPDRYNATANLVEGHPYLKPLWYEIQELLGVTHAQVETCVNVATRGPAGSTISPGSSSSGTVAPEAAVDKLDELRDFLAGWTGENRVKRTG